MHALASHSPTVSLGAIVKSPASLRPQVIEGIAEIKDFLEDQLNGFERDGVHRKHLSDAYRGFGKIAPPQPLDQVLIDTLAKLVGLEETYTMKPLRIALHNTMTGKKMRLKPLVSHLKKEAALGRTDRRVAVKTLMPVRNLIANHVSLTSLKEHELIATEKPAHRALTLDKQGW